MSNDPFNFWGMILFVGFIVLVVLGLGSSQHDGAVIVPDKCYLQAVGHEPQEVSCVNP